VSSTAFPSFAPPFAAAALVGLLTASAGSSATDAPRLRDVRVEADGAARVVVLAFTRVPEDVRPFHLDDPPRLVVDVPRADREPGALVRVPSGDAVIGGVRVGEAAGRLRIVVDLRQAAPPTVAVRPEGLTLVARVEPSPAAPAVRAGPAPPDVVLALGDVLEVAYAKRYVDDRPYRLEVGDGVRVTVADRPELGYEGVVLPDGTLTLPLLGPVSVRGRTVPAAAALLTRRFGRHLDGPRVDVLVTRPRARADDFFSVVLAGRRGPVREIVLTGAFLELPLIAPVPALGRPLAAVRADLDAAYADALPEVRVAVTLLRRDAHAIPVGAGRGL
jgi:hypothetical protein